MNRKNVEKYTEGSSKSCWIIEKSVSKEKMQVSPSIIWISEDCVFLI